MPAICVGFEWQAGRPWTRWGIASIPSYVRDAAGPSLHQAVVERLFAWLSRYRRLNIVYDRAPDLFAAHIWIAMISIISRRLVARTQL
jgi:transposase